ncbi:MAG: glycosyltransferase family 9 protein [Oceanidesulfovibrio sp.]
MPPPSIVSRILVCQLSRLGDVLLATPAIECLARSYPDAEVHVLTDTRAVPLLEGNPHIAAIHAARNAEMAGPLRAWRIAMRLTREHRFDVVVDFQQTMLTRITSLLSGASMRIADKRAFYLRPFYTHTLVRRHGYAARSKIDLLEPLGIEWGGERPRIYLNDVDRTRAGSVLSELFPGLPKSMLVTLDSTQQRVCRCWPADHFARLLARVARDHADIAFLPLYGPGEAAHVEEVRRKAVEQGVAPERIRMASEAMDLRTTAACIEGAGMHVGNCSLPRHLAVAVGTPTLVVLGPTDEASWTFPWRERGGKPHETARAQMACAPCAVAGSRGDCGEPRCMEALDVDSVAELLGRMLEKGWGGNQS